MQSTPKEPSLDRFVSLSEKFQLVLLDLGVACAADRREPMSEGKVGISSYHLDACQEIVNAVSGHYDEFENLIFAFEDRIIAADGCSHRIAEHDIGTMGTWKHHYIAETAHHFVTLPLQNIAGEWDLAGLTGGEPIEKYAEVLADNQLDDREIERIACRMHRELALLVASLGGIFPERITLQAIAGLTRLEVSSLSRYRKEWPQPLSGRGRQPRSWQYNDSMREILKRQFPHIEFPDSLT